MWFILLSCVGLYLAWVFLRPKVRISYANRAVFITGCDTGFGNLLTKHLDKAGVRVFAGCLTANGAESLTKSCSALVTPILMDVTKEADIASAVAQVQAAIKADTLELWGIVNNAGIIDGFWVDLTPMNNVRRTFEVNFLGTVATTKAFLPLLKRSRGRIVNIASLAGRLAAPAFSAYAASKYAVEGFSDALRREVINWGVRVSIIEPGFMKTPMVMENAAPTWRKFFDNAPQELRDEYGADFWEQYSKEVAFVHSISGDPNEVVLAIDDALFTSLPKHRYLCGLDAKVMVYASYLPTEWFDVLFGILHRSHPRPAAKLKDA